MEIEKETLELFHKLKYHFMETQNLDLVLSFLDDDATWVFRQESTSTHNLSSTIQEYITSPKSPIYTIECHKDSFTYLSKNTFSIFGDVHLIQSHIAPSPIGQELPFGQAYSILIQTPTGLKLAQIQFFFPEVAYSNPCFFSENPFSPAKQRQEWKFIMENLPGGVLRCLNDKYFSILRMNHGFLSMFGYTEEEMYTLFDNRFLHMILPADRQGLFEKIKNQLAHGDTFELEYRVLCRNGKIKWVLERSRLVDVNHTVQTSCCFILDITIRKQAQEELRLSLERYQIIMNQTTDIIFEWDIQGNQILVSSNWEKKFGYSLSQMNFEESFNHSPKLHPEDQPKLIRATKQIKSGTEYVEIELRILDKSKQFRWCRIRATTQYDDQKHPIKSVGIIVDIDSEKKHIHQLKRQALRDPLTNLFNKLAIRKEIEKRLELFADHPHALMILDLDDFKNVNDQFGHLCGDTILTETGKLLTGLFRSSDLIGRIGGDEFLIFLEDIHHKKDITHKVTELIHLFQSLSANENKEISISCSIGIALYPQDGKDFITLYQNADYALYQTKKHGKNNFSFYSDGAESFCPSHHYTNPLSEISPVSPRENKSERKRTSHHNGKNKS